MLDGHALDAFLLLVARVVDHGADRVSLHFLRGVLKKSNDRKTQIAEAVWAVLSRPPTLAEYELFESYLERRKDRPDAALQQMVWALINSPQFRFNH